ncbi:MAG: hypothetical protein C5B54_00575 [Acidobacteria bacterium]|nr:MAG: hypothetical protein C5B54_00575 [Acidobacteriota bacterium]
MTEQKYGTIVYWHTLSPGLAIFRLMPQPGTSFPSYEAGQYASLKRENCRLTKRIGTQSDGRPIYGPELDESGKQKLGSVIHSYSIASAPYETETQGYLEFFLIRERNVGFPGRLTESLFSMDLKNDNSVEYLNEIGGEFTVSRRAAESKHILFVGTGTGLAPFAAMIKQLHYEAQSSDRRYTLIHTNRTFDELGYHTEMQAIEAAGKIDFLYIPTVSRPTQRDLEDPKLGVGRANNVLRKILDMSLKEEEDLQDMARKGEDILEAKRTLDHVIKPELPKSVALQTVRQRMNASETVIFSCGNFQAMADIKYAAEKNQIRFEKEDW